MKGALMKKKLLSILLTAGLTFSITAAAANVSVQNFQDIKSSDWHYPSVTYAVSQGLFSGTSDTTFSPDAAMTRGMLVTVLGRYSKVNVSHFQGASFSDVPVGEYYAPYVKWASERSIVNGTGNGMFSPNASITREQLATMIYNYAKHVGADATLQSRDKYYTFIDNYNTSVYAVEAMQWATAQGIVNGNNAMLDPQGTATRAQVATIFMNAEDILQARDGDNNPLPTPGITPVPTVSPNIDPTPQPTEEPWTPPVIVTDEIDKRPTGKSATDQYGGYYDYDLANYIFDAVNDIREENGLARTAYSLKVGEWSDIRSREVWQINYDDNQWGNPHVRPDGASFSTVGYKVIGENATFNNTKLPDPYMNENGEWVMDWGYTVEVGDGTAYTVYEALTIEEYIAKWGWSISSSWYHSEGHRKNQLNLNAQTSAVSAYVIDGYVYFIHLFDAENVHLLNRNA